MDRHKDGKRKKDKHNDDDEEIFKERKSKRLRSRSRSPAYSRDKNSTRKRRHSKSRSPDSHVKLEKQSNTESEVLAKKNVPERRARETDMLNTRTGGAYIPPARLRMMQAQITDKSSVAYQRLAWEALKKSIHGHINKINVGNIGIIIKELLKENIVRGRGLLCRSVIQAQAASPTFTNVYAALVAAVNSRFPNIGELLLKRLVIQFKRGFKRNDKSTCISSVSFVAHLINQRVAHEILALELLTLLVETPTDDSVEVAIAFLKECGQKLTEVSSKGVNAIFEMLRNILHEGQLDKRVQYMIEVMFQVWKDGFKDHPALIEELELVPEEEQFTHLLMLDDATDPQDILNVFKFDEKYEENEQKYKTLSKEILGSDAESGEDDGSGESGSEESEEEEEAQKEVTIIDNTETNLIALRRTIYLTINSSLDFEECAHKLMKMQLKPGQEVELCHMFLDCCAEQRTYEKFYGLLAQRFCGINRIYIGPFEEIFKDSYATAHRLDTNRLRNVSKFFAHLLFTDSISWEVMECVRLNEEDTTSSSRIYIKILFQELAEYMGLKKLNDRLKDPTLQEAFSGVFPRDNPKNTRFSINFFTSIGLGGLTDELREHLKQMPKNIPPPVTDIKLDSETSSDSSSDSSSSSSDDSSSDSSTDSDEDKSKTKKKNKTKKDNSPQESEVRPPKDTERWGHDGFYDTYGKDARRTESRPDNRNRDNFSRSRGARETNGDRNEQKIGNERSNRKDDRYVDNEDRRTDRNIRDDNRRRRDDVEERYKDDDRRRRDDDVEERYRREAVGKSDREEESRRRERKQGREDDHEKYNSRSYRDDKARKRDSDSRHNEEGRANHKKSYNEDLRRESRTNHEDRSKNGHEQNYNNNDKKDSQSNRGTGKSIDKMRDNRERDESRSNREDRSRKEDEEKNYRGDDKRYYEKSRDREDNRRDQLNKSNSDKYRNTETEENRSDKRNTDGKCDSGVKKRDGENSKEMDENSRHDKYESRKDKDKRNKEDIKDKTHTDCTNDGEHEKRNKDTNKKSSSHQKDKKDKKREKKKRKDSSSESSNSSSDSEEDIRQVSKRYWDVLEVKSKKEAMDVETKDCARKKRS